VGKKIEAVRLAAIYHAPHWSSCKLQASGDSTANSTRGRVEEPEAASHKLDNKE